MLLSNHYLTINLTGHIYRSKLFLPKRVFGERLVRTILIAITFETTIILHKNSTAVEPLPGLHSFGRWVKEPE